MVSLFGTVFSFLDDEGDKAHSEAIKENDNVVTNLANEEIGAVDDEGGSEVCFNVVDDGKEAEGVKTRFEIVPNKEFKCDKCNFSFNTIFELRKHIKRIHEKERNFKCNGCDFKFFTNHEMRIHYKKKHKELELEKDEEKSDKEFKCKLCNYSTSIEVSLEHHQKRTHDKVRNFNCNICDHKTYEYSEMKKHQASSHSEEKANLLITKIGQIESKDYKCKNCNYSTDKKGSLVMHIERRHEKILNYECSLCGHKRYGKQEMEGHIKNKHPNVNCSIIRLGVDGPLNTKSSEDPLESKSSDDQHETKSSEDPLESTLSEDPLKTEFAKDPLEFLE